MPRPPSLTLALTEVPRAMAETLDLTLNLGPLIRRHRGTGDHPVLVLPGYGGADGSTLVLRQFLKRIGYRTYALRLGRNVEAAGQRIQSVDDATRFREAMVRRVTRRVRDIHALTGEKVSLVGWSMGGLYAVDASHEVPELVRQVITLGSPFGDPRGTSLFKLMRRLSGSRVPIEAQDFSGWTGKATAPKVPTRVIYSHKDGIVGTSVARLPAAELTEHLAVESSHIAFAVNPQALGAVAQSLARVA